MTQSIVPLSPAGAPGSGCVRDQVHGARTHLLDDAAYGSLAETFRVLADSTRAKIVHTLAAYPLCVGDLARVTGVSEPAVSQHLRLLRSLRIVRGRRQGKMVVYTLEDAHIRALLTMALSHQEEASPAELTQVSS